MQNSLMYYVFKHIICIEQSAPSISIICILCITPRHLDHRLVTQRALLLETIDLLLYTVAEVREAACKGALFKYLSHGLGRG